MFDTRFTRNYCKKKESDIITIFSVFSEASILRDLRMGKWTKEEDFSRLTSQRKKAQEEGIG